MIKIVYACNDKLFDGLYLSILSILRRTKEPISFYLLTADFKELKPSYTKLSASHENIISELVHKYNSDNSFTVIDCKKDYIRLFGPNNKNARNHCSVYALLRLLIGSYKCFSGKVIYLDTDTMACGDIKELYDVNLKNNEFAVAHNLKLVRWYQKENYFNSGVILFNLDATKKTHLFTKAISMLKDKKMLNSDQIALYKSATKFMFFPGDDYRFNRQTGKVKKGDIIRHFTYQVFGIPGISNIKQWQKNKVHRYLKIHEFDADYEIYQEMLDEFKKGKKDDFFIRVKNLCKSYGSIKAVNNISFNVKKGSLFAFLGVNGAGKSTTINIISSTLSKDSGDIAIGGYDLIKDNASVKEMIGIVFQNSALDDLLTVKENLVIRARFYNMKKDEIAHAIERVSNMLNLKPILNQDVGKLSGGQKRRVDIARALIHEPKLLMLDEPTTGLDPKTRLDVWRLIDEIRQRTKMTVFLTTHYLEEAEKATYVEIMNKGKIIAEGTPNELKNKYSTDTIIAYQKKNKDFEKNVKGYKYIYDNDAYAYRIAIKDSNDAKKVLEKYSKYINDFEIQKGDMNSVFLNVVGRVK